MESEQIKSFKEFVTERDMVGWYSIPNAVQDELKKLGFDQKSTKSGVTYVIEDDLGELFTKVIVEASVPSREVVRYAKNTEGVTLDRGYPSKGFTLIIKR